MLAVTAAVLIAAAALLSVLPRTERLLVLSDAESGRVFLSLPVTEGERFSVTFVHSVHQTPVTDVYELRGGKLLAVESRFYTFGAGMQTEYPDGVTFTYAPDGEIIASGYAIDCTGMIWCVGMVSDHVLELDGEAYSLRALCGRGTLVTFDVR